MRLSSNFFARATISLLLSSIATHATEPHKRAATVCNGHSELCNRSFGNVTFVGAHNSYAVGVNNLAANQDYDVDQQLKDGIRMLQMQTHLQDGVVNLCHTTCLLYNGGPLVDYLTKVKTWMDSNPNEVLSLLIVNSENLDATKYDPIFKSVGLDKYAYAPPSATLPASGWPTLGALIDSGKRLLVFIDNGALFNSVPYIIDEFTNIWETAFDVIDNSFDCAVNRTKGDAPNQMFLINHFLDKLVYGQPAPYIAKANETNLATGTGSVGAQIANCVAAHGKNPNFILVDFYEYGNGGVFKAAAAANGVSWNPSSGIAQPIPTTSSGAIRLTTSHPGISLVPLLAVFASFTFGALIVS